MNIDEYAWFIEELCGDRQYQKEAIYKAIDYLTSGKYRSVEDIVTEDKDHIQIPNRLSAVIDLATGTGKSYVMYGIARIMLGLGLVDKVLVLCPSLTIEDGLMRKFYALAGDNRLELPESAKYRKVEIVDASRTIRNGEICIENSQVLNKNSMKSMMLERSDINENCDRILVLNDEVHHVYNEQSDYDMKKWKEFIVNRNFKYVLGFTGTAYIGNKRFNDIIYSYSLKQAIRDRYVKNIEYISKDDAGGKFEKIYNNHIEIKNSLEYIGIRPITIFVTSSIIEAKILLDRFIEFLGKKEAIPRMAVEKKVLIVTSSEQHKRNIPILRNVDSAESTIEWIISISMLTEGWDVKNVFQIIPCKERAFNSKLLIAQVLGRGLRIPERYIERIPNVIVFNHEKWSKRIESLVDDLIGIDIPYIMSSVLENSIYHFNLYRLNYIKKERWTKSQKQKENHIELKIGLFSQSIYKEYESEYIDILTKETRMMKTIEERTCISIDEICDNILIYMKNRNISIENVDLLEIIRNAVLRVGIDGNFLTEENAEIIYNAFEKYILDINGLVFDIERTADTLVQISTKDIKQKNINVGEIGGGISIFYTEDYIEECIGETRTIMCNIESNEELPRKAIKKTIRDLLKTPLDITFSESEPERIFINKLVQSENCQCIDAWIKSRDKGFYGIEYSYSICNRHKRLRTFNPDFFLKCGDNILVIEIKDDNDISVENVCKIKESKKYFNELNKELRNAGINQTYLFYFLSPISYQEFFEYIRTNKILEFKSKLERELK